MILHFKIDQNEIAQKLTGDDIETIELHREGEQVGSYRIKRMAARFMVDEIGAAIPYAKALKVFGSMNAEEYGDGLNQFMQAMTDAALPKANGTPSNSPSVASTIAASPAGSSLSKLPKNGDVPPGKLQGNGQHPGGGSSGENEEISTPENL